MPQSDPPSFLLIGTMKSGTTTLFRWLQQVTDSELCRSKEPGFFSHERQWRRGLTWYLSLFPRDAITGEASTSYTHPDYAERAAERIESSLPTSKLIVLLRDPIERTRSHYRHEVQRGRERRPFAEAATPDSVYCRQSLYATVLRPYLDRFNQDRLLILQSEAVFGHDTTAWYRLLEFLKLESVPRPGEAHNVTEHKSPYTRLMGRLYGTPLVHQLERSTPRPVRRLLKPLFIRAYDTAADALIQESRSQRLQIETAGAITGAISSLPESLNLDLSLWNLKA